MMALIDCGAMPIVGEMFHRVKNSLDEREDLAIFRFPDFLAIVGQIRAEEAAARKAAIQSLFAHQGWTNLHTVSADDVPMLMVQLGICTDCCYRVEDVVTLVEDCNKDGMEMLTINELVLLVGKATERARAQARSREAAVAREAGFRPNQLLELRIGFAGLSITGVVGVLEIKRLLEEINHNVEFREKDVQALMSEAAPPMPASHTVKEDSLRDAVRFKDPNDSISSSLSHVHQDEHTDGQAQRHHAEAAGLRFDGYLRLAARILRG